MNGFKYDIGVIGLGRVGLPLALTLAKREFNVIGFDIDKDLVELVNNNKVPFKETGYEKIIKKVRFKAYEDISKIKDAENIIITVGTPLSPHIETDLSQIFRVLDSIKPNIKKEHNIILRSTVAPETTKIVKKYLEQNLKLHLGNDIFLSYCPERLAEGKAMEELMSLPQIIGSEDNKSGKKAEKIFSKLTKDIIHTDFISAELVKLFNNISRYIHFSVANQFAIIADSYNANIYDIIHMTNYKYPRGVIPQPGLTAGTCLRKDFGMINETIPYTDLLLSAWKINEFMPKFLVENIKKRTDIYGKTVSVLGYTFKQNVDDTRDSLVPKLIRYIKREIPKHLYINDPNLPQKIDNEYNNTDWKNCVRKADILFIAINHDFYTKHFIEIINLCKPDTWIVDLWNVSNQGMIFFKVKNISINIKKR